MIGNSPGISIVELWPCEGTFPTFLHREVVAAVNKMLTDKCITCQKISGHVFPKRPLIYKSALATRTIGENDDQRSRFSLLLFICLISYGYKTYLECFQIVGEHVYQV